MPIGCLFVCLFVSFLSFFVSCKVFGWFYYQGSTILMELVVKCPSSLPFLSSFLLINFSHGYGSQFSFWRHLYNFSLDDEYLELHVVELWFCCILLCL